MVGILGRQISVHELLPITIMSSGGSCLKYPRRNAGGIQKRVWSASSSGLGMYGLFFSIWYLKIPRVYGSMLSWCSRISSGRYRVRHSLADQIWSFSAILGKCLRFPWSEQREQWH